MLILFDSCIYLLANKNQTFSFLQLDRQTFSIAIRFLKAKTPEQRAAVDLDTHYTKVNNVLCLVYQFPTLGHYEMIEGDFWRRMQIYIIFFFFMFYIKTGMFMCVCVSSPYQIKEVTIKQIALF